MEVRRGARVATTFLVAIDGVERYPELRKGDISATGVYFETSRDVGAVGTIHWLHLVSVDSARSLRVMAHVVRTVLLADAVGQRVGGAAFEFMPVSDEASTSLQDFVKYVLALRRPGIEPHIASRLDAQALGGKGDEPGAPPTSHAATVRKLSVRSMVLETSWAISPGEAVRVDIVAPGMTRRIRLDGRAVRVARVTPGVTPADPSSYAIEVEVQEETERPIRRHSSRSFQAVREEDAAAAAKAGTSKPAATPLEDEDINRTLDDLLAALILPPEDSSTRNRVHHLSGQLSRVRLPTLLALFDMERMEGKLVVRRGSDEVNVYFSSGQIVDVDPLPANETRRVRLKAVLGWEEGSFEFYVEPVFRQNRVEMSTTALLLDLAREADEEAAKGRPVYEVLKTRAMAPTRFGALAAAVAVSAGCFLSPIPNMQTPVDHARELSVRCKGFPDANGAQLVSPAMVESVEPDYSHVPTGSGTEARLQGARIHLRPVGTSSAESMARNLECHQASVTLGKSAAVVDDPYVLPNAWLEIDVSSEGDGFVARVRGEDFETARSVLARARRFAGVK